MPDPISLPGLIRPAGGKRALRRRVCAVTLALAFLTIAGPCRAGSLGGAPLVGLGYSQADTNNQELLTLLLGWRLLYGVGERLDGWLRPTHWRGLLVVEPSLSLVGGDQSTFEMTVVPMLRLERRNQRWPDFYVEGGAGLIYSEIRRIRLGSQILFNDSFGFGWSLPTSGGRLWSVGYRFRHISHAKIWARSNRGLQTHFLTLTLAGPAG